MWSTEELIALGCAISFVLVMLVLLKLMEPIVSVALDAFCIFGFVLKFAADCIIFMYGLNWLRLTNLSIGGAAPEHLLTLRIVLGVILAPLSDYLFLIFIDRSTMTDKRMLTLGSLCHFSVIFLMGTIKLDIDRGECSAISPRALSYCETNPIAKGYWFSGHAIASIAWAGLCLVQLFRDDDSVPVPQTKKQD